MAGEAKDMEQEILLREMPADVQGFPPARICLYGKINQSSRS